MALYFYEEIDELGEGLIRQYLGAEADNTFCVDIEGFVTEFLGLPLFYRTFAEKDSDKIGFISDGITPLRIYKNGTIAPTVFSKGTIVIEKYLRRENESGRRRFTISHEGAHFVMDRTVPQASFHREYDNERSYTPKDLKRLFSFKETQIDRMGAALLMPRFMVFNVVKTHGVKDGLPIYGDSILRVEDKLLIQEMANAMGVSFTAFLIRLRELGILRRHELSEYITGEMGLGKAGELL